MKRVGIVLIGLGAVLFVYAIFSFFGQKDDHVLSPVPADRGVKVIFVTPTSAR